MKRQLITALSLSTLALTACGEDPESQPAEEEMTEETADEEIADQKEAENEDEKEDAEEGETEEETTEVNEQIVDDENVRVELVDIDYVYDEFWDDEKYEVNFDITNNTDNTITAQARDLSINDTMVDESLLSMSQDIAAGKNAIATLTIEDLSGDELPELEGNLEMTLHIFNEADFEDIGDYPVSIDLN